MAEDEPNIVYSSKAEAVLIDGYRFQIDIYRLETEPMWSLEVVDFEGTSHVWDDLFASDKDAHIAALEALEEEGPLAFMRGDNVVPLRRR